MVIQWPSRIVVQILSISFQRCAKSQAHLDTSFAHNFDSGLRNSCHITAHAILDYSQIISLNFLVLATGGKETRTMSYTQSCTDLRQINRDRYTCIPSFHQINSECNRRLRDCVQVHRG